MSYVKIDVQKPATVSPGRGGNKKNKVTVVDVADILTEAKRDSNGVVIAAKHIFKANAYAITLEITPTSLSGKATSDGDLDAEGVTQEFVFEHPGSEQEIREFRANWLGKDVMIFDERCSDGRINQYGEACNPVRMKFEATDDKDVNKSVFTFASVSKGNDVAIYNNTLTLSTPISNVAADAISIDLTAGAGEYQLTDNTVATAITTATNATDGMVFTLLGSGGVNPATISAGDFVLSGGVSWSGIANAKITFKAFKDGASSWKFFELSRS